MQQRGKQGCGNSFSGNISDEESVTSAAKTNYVKTIAADGVAGKRGAGHRQFCSVRERFRKQGFLNLARDFDLVVQPLFGSRGSEKPRVLDNRRRLPRQAAQNLPIEVRKRARGNVAIKVQDTKQLPLARGNCRIEGFNHGQLVDWDGYDRM